MNLILLLHLQRVTRLIRVYALVMPAVPICWGIVVRPRMESVWNVAGMTGNSPPRNMSMLTSYAGREGGGRAQTSLYISVDVTTAATEEFCLWFTYTRVSGCHLPTACGDVTFMYKKQ